MAITCSDQATESSHTSADINQEQVALASTLPQDGLHFIHNRWLTKATRFDKSGCDTTCRKFRDLRLLALGTAPESFASSYETEVNADLQNTLQRLSDARASHFVAVQSTPQRDDTHVDLLDARWVGMIVPIGPVAVKISAHSDPLHQTAPGAIPGRYHLHGVFVHPSIRRAGVGRGLIAAALNKGITEPESRGEYFYCTIMVDSENSAAEALYRSSGFRVIGTEKYVQQARSSSLDGIERLAIVMELQKLHVR